MFLHKNKVCLSGCGMNTGCNLRADNFRGSFCHQRCTWGLASVHPSFLFLWPLGFLQGTLCQAPDSGKSVNDGLTNSLEPLVPFGAAAESKYHRTIKVAKDHLNPPAPSHPHHAQ